LQAVIINNSKKRQDVIAIVNEFFSFKKPKKLKVEEFNEIKAKGSPEDPNDIADTYVAILNCRQYATEEQKKSLIDDQFVQNMVEKTISIYKRLEK
jgi:hypothetical protein